MSRDGTLPRLDAAIFADTQWEPAAVYRHLAWLVGEIGDAIPIYRVTIGDIRADILRSVQEPGSRNDSPLTLARLTTSALLTTDEVVLPRRRASKRFVSMPLHVRNPEGDHGMLRRQCTAEYKIYPITAALRHLTGRAPRVRKGPAVEQWMGISMDEWQRQSSSHTSWITLRYPLVQMRMSRADCLAWLRTHDYPEPPKSSCLGCPFHGNAQWRQLLESSPGEWANVVAFDAAIRALTRQGVNCPAYLHHDLQPLDQVDLRTYLERVADSGQMSLPGFAETGEAPCDSGYCWS